MEKMNQPEMWLRGPLPNIPALLQPVAHALLQAREEINALMEDFPEDKLWTRIAGMASVGFHLQHLTGVLDRLFTYADDKLLSEKQLTYLKLEVDNNGNGVKALIEAFNTQVDRSLNILSQVDEHNLTQKRGVGRAQLPSTIIGLYVHAAEHSMRHTGQLLVTVTVLKSK